MPYSSEFEELFRERMGAETSELFTEVQSQIEAGGSIAEVEQACAERIPRLTTWQRWLVVTILRHRDVYERVRRDVLEAFQLEQGSENADYASLAFERAFDRTVQRWQELEKQ
jgi:hypothetical protein